MHSLVALVRLSDFDYALPESAIARHPAPRRDQSRLLVVDRATRKFAHHEFSDLTELLSPDDLLVVNDTKVLAGRLQTTKVGTGGRVEILLVDPVEGAPDTWRAMAQGSKSLRIGQGLQVDAGLPPLEVVANVGGGFVHVRLPIPAEPLADRFGALPLPPYIKRAAEPADLERYQTVFAAADRRSVAAPTAGLHFTPELLARIAARGIGRASVTLHVGPGTFLPVRTEDLDEHQMHAERFELTAENAERIENHRRGSGRVVAVGTTVCRLLETVGAPVGRAEGATDLFIRPGFDFQVLDALITNFHLPRSTLLMLVSAFADRELVLAAYREAVDSGYRFYSYGDAMLVL